jgi:hypothetical protein
LLRRIALSFEKLCPVHRSFFAMSGRVAQICSYDVETKNLPQRSFLIPNPYSLIPNH